LFISSAQSTLKKTNILLKTPEKNIHAESLYLAYRTEFRSCLSALWRKSVESASAGAQICKAPEQPYRHAAIWRFSNSCPRSGAFRARSRIL
jgi:hypothetical protein